MLCELTSVWHVLKDRQQKSVNSFANWMQNKNRNNRMAIDCMTAENWVWAKIWLHSFSHSSTKLTYRKKNFPFPPKNTHPSSQPPHPYNLRGSCLSSPVPVPWITSCQLFWASVFISVGRACHDRWHHSGITAYFPGYFPFLRVTSHRRRLAGDMAFLFWGFKGINELQVGEHEVSIVLGGRA